jgi:secreted PhoX family phosphatase
MNKSQQFDEGAGTKLTSAPVRRRALVKAGVAGAASMAFGALAARKAEARSFGGRFSPDYGPLSPKKDLATGLSLLALPEGFRYTSFGWTGQRMADGRPTPGGHDGMAVVARRGHILALVRNHELAGDDLPNAFVDRGTYNVNEAGGTTSLFFSLFTGRFFTSYTSLGGTIRNCAGGSTPWGSWLSCEETFHTWGNRADGFNHGYIFEVPGFGMSNGRPIRAAGRFSHEAVAVDPHTGIVYETEDTGASGFYTYVPPGAGEFARRGLRGPLRDGGELYAMVVDGMSRKDLRGGFDDGKSFGVTWQKVGDPEGISGSAFASAPDAAIIARGEGAWYDAGKIYFVSSSGGASGLGQVWVYDPRRELLTLLYESRASTDVDGPDNVAISPRGGIVLCEDGDSDPKRLVGLTPDGQTFDFAKNNIVLTASDLDRVESVYPGTKQTLGVEAEGAHTAREWAGATFHGNWLFANIQTPGITFAITGPWHKGAL